MNKQDGKLKQRIICNHLGWKQYETEIYRLYTDNAMSANEIAEMIEQNLPEISKHATMTPRSISRAVVRFGQSHNIGRATRGTKESFQNAIRRGRVIWVYKDKKVQRKRLPDRLRMEILQRDGFACVLCGATAKTDLLEVDHIVPLCKGGLTIRENLRTLCYPCNKGKRMTGKEHGGGSMRSGAVYLPDPLSV